MKNVVLTFSICLVTVLGGLSPVSAQCKVASTGISAVTGGYTVTLPPAVFTAVPTSEPLRLVLRDAAGEISSVSGPVRVLASGQIWIQTRERFSFSPEKCPTEAVLQRASLNQGSCGSAEFGIGCFLKWCAGQTYCLPGDGPGGMQCVCL